MTQGKESCCCHSSCSAWVVAEGAWESRKEVAEAWAWTIQGKAWMKPVVVVVAWALKRELDEA